MNQREASRSRLSRRRLITAGAGATGAAALGLLSGSSAGAAPAQTAHRSFTRFQATPTTIEVPNFSSSVESKPVKLTLWTFVDTHARWFQAMGEAYKAQVNPDFELEVVQTAYDDHHTKLLVSMQSGGVGAPDLADIEQGRFGGFMKLQSGMEDLTDELQSGGYLDDLVAARESLYTINGRIYGIEHALCPVVLYYRSDIYTSMTPDAPLATWDDFIAATKDVATGDVKGLGLDWGLYDIVLKQQGFDIFDAEGKVTADSPEAVKTLEWILALRDTHGVAAEPPAGAQATGTAADQSWYGAVNEGKYIAIPGADWYAGFLRDNVSDLSGKWAAQYLPAFAAGGARTSVYGGTGNTIISTSDKKDAAWDFQRYSMLSAEGSVQRFLLVKLWPPLKSAWPDERLYSADPYFGDQELGRLFTEIGPEAPAQYQSAFRSDLLTLRNDKYTRDIFDGKLSPADGLRQLADEIRAMM
jgi:arabinosaccharide transport system substrate-binding protein